MVKELSLFMGKDCNSYSKTDLEATFMRMKDDHMMNGQLKPAYNVQIAVENYFIIHGYISNDRTDYNTLIPVVRKHFHAFEEKLKEVTADSGYCSEKNLLFLKEHNMDSYIKLQDHEKRKTRAYKEDIGKHYNMTTQIFEDEHYYICHDGRELRHIGYSYFFEIFIYARDTWSIMVCYSMRNFFDYEYNKVIEETRDVSKIIIDIFNDMYLKQHMLNEYTYEQII